MDASEDVAVFPDIDLDLDFDGFDFDLAAGFCGDEELYFVAGADKNSAAVRCFDLDVDSPERGSSSREGSPESAVTDGPLAAGDGSMSAYVRELERFLMEDDDDDEVVGPDGKRTGKLAGDEYLADLFDVFADSKDMVAVDAGEKAEAKEEEETLVAPEDDTASRKRARHKRDVDTAMKAREELAEVTRRHLDVPAPRFHLHRLLYGVAHGS